MEEHPQQEMYSGKPKLYPNERPTLRSSRRRKSSSSASLASSSSKAPPAHTNGNNRRADVNMGISTKLTASKFFDGVQVFERLNAEGFYVLDNFLVETSEGGVMPNNCLENICAEAKKVFLERRFGEDGKLAGTNGDDVLDHRKRSDLTFTLPWNDKHVIYHCLPAFQQFISLLREALLPALEEGLKVFKQKAGPQEKSQLYWQCCDETNQLALLENPSLSCFPQERKAYFRRHLDSHFRINHGSKNVFSPVIDKRKLTILFYLNRSWNLSTDGGALRMWVGPESFPNNLTEPRGEVVEVAPLLNRLLIFWSDSVPHEVHATSRDRYAATLWLAEVSQ